jgi:hypothetical protein
MFVIAHDEPDIVPREPLVARHDVGGDLLVGGAKVGTAVDVVNSGCQIETRHGQQIL